jgi:hypothetical protein
VFPQGVDGARGSVFVPRGEDGAEEHDSRDHRRVGPFLRDRGDRAADDEDQLERAAQLPGDAPGESPVFAPCGGPRRGTLERLRVGEAGGVGSEPAKQRFRAVRPPGIHHGPIGLHRETICFSPADCR